MTKLKKSTKNYLKQTVKNKLKTKMNGKKGDASTDKKDNKKPSSGGGGGGGRKPMSGKGGRKPSGGGGGKKVTQEEHDGTTDGLQDDGYNLGILSGSEDGDSESDISESIENGQEDSDAEMSEAESDGEDLLKEDSGDESEADNELDHKAQLDALKESDPAFYKFMQENDKDLLNFGGSDDELEVEEEDVDEDAVDKEDPEEQEGQIILTTDMITKWKLTMASDKSLRALKKLLIAFRAAVASAGDSDKDPGEFRYTIPSSAIFNSVMVAAMTYAPVILDYHLMVAGRNSRQYAYIYLPSRSGLPSASTKWKKLQPMVKSFLTNLLKALKIMTDSSMIQFSIQTSSAGEFHGALPLLACFPKLSKDYIKTLAGLWTQTGSSESEKVRIVSVIALRKLVVVAPAFIDLVLKHTYSSYISVASKTTSLNIPTLEFLCTSLTELQLLSPPQAIYNHAFTNIRKLAMLLRAAINSRTEEAVKRLYSWSFLWSCRLWANVLAGGVEAGIGGRESTLKPLIYPLVQVLLGVMSKYFPHRFHCVKLAIEMSKKTGVFIPVASYLFEIFDSVEITKLGTPSTNKPFEFKANVRAPKGYVGSRVYQTGVIEQSVDLLYEYFGLYAHSISFPELVLPAIFHLKKYTKSAPGKNVVFSKQVAGLIEKLAQNRDFILGHRASVEFSPKNTEQVGEFNATFDDKSSPLKKYMDSKRNIAAKVAST